MHAYRHLGNAIFLMHTSDASGCFVQGKDVVIPPMMQQWIMDWYRAAAAANVPPAKESRDLIAFWKGEIPTDALWSYSRGVRQYMYKHWRSRPGWAIEGAWGHLGDNSVCHTTRGRH